MTNKERVGIYLLKNTGIMYMLYIVCFVLAVFIGIMVPDTVLGEYNYMIKDLLPYFFGFFIVVVFGSFLRLWPVCGFHKTKWLNILMCFVLSVPVFYLVYDLNILMTKLLPRTIVAQDVSGKPMWYLILTLAFLPAVLEEIVFRGFILHVFKLRSLTAGIVVSSVAFSLYHMDATSVLYTLVFGVLAAYICEVTGSIFCSMLLHFLNNLYTLLAWNYQDTGIVQSLMVDHTAFYVISGVLSFVLICAGLYFMSVRNKWCDRTETNKTYPILPVGYIIGFIVSVGIMLLSF